MEFEKLGWNVERLPGSEVGSQSQFGLLTSGTSTPSPLNFSTDSIISMPAALRPLSPWLEQVSIETWLLAIWALGATIGIVHLLRARRRCLEQLAADCGEPDRATLGLLNNLVSKSKTNRRPELLFSSELSSPIALAGGTLYVPARVVDELSETEQQAVLAHELAHTVRRDPEWQLVLAVLSRLFFFQPLLRLTARRLETEAELLCDDHAAVWAGSGVALARGLRQVAIWTCDKARVPAWTGTPMVLPADSNRSALVQRVERLLADRVETPTRRSRLTLFATLGLFAVAMACTGPGVDVSDPRNRASVSHEGNGLPIIRAALLNETSAETSSESGRSTFGNDPEGQICVLILDKDGNVTFDFPDAIQIPVTEGDLLIAGSLSYAGDAKGFGELLEQIGFATLGFRPTFILKIGLDTGSNEWLTLLQELAAAGQANIQFEMSNETLIATPMSSMDTGVVPNHSLEISIIVANEGRRIELDSNLPWSGDGPFKFDGRSVRYTATGPDQPADQAGMVSSQGLATDTVAGVASYVSAQLEEQPGLGAIIIAGEGTVFDDVDDLLEALKTAGVQRIEFVGRR